jgi:hypothetical protein
MIRVHDPGGEERVQKFIYTAWNIWMERCHQVYDSQGITADQLEDLIRHDVQQWAQAWHGRAQEPG